MTCVTGCFAAGAEAMPLARPGHSGDEPVAEASADQRTDGRVDAAEVAVGPEPVAGRDRDGVVADDEAEDGGEPLHIFGSRGFRVCHSIEAAGLSTSVEMKEFCGDLREF